MTQHLAEFSFGQKIAYREITRQLNDFISTMKDFDGVEDLVAAAEASLATIEKDPFDREKVNASFSPFKGVQTYEGKMYEAVLKGLYNHSTSFGA